VSFTIDFIPRFLCHGCLVQIYSPFGRREMNGKKKKKKNFKNILFFPLFGSLSRREWKGMERPFPCLRV
jgi:hypothetical protein